MEKLSIQDWSLIARFIHDEASDTDLHVLNSLLQIHPGLKDEIRNLGLRVQISVPEFDAESAFKKLHDRLEDEDLI